MASPPLPDPGVALSTGRRARPVTGDRSRSFPWTDARWRSRPARDLVIYELHVGTFTPEGTFAGVERQLPYLRDLGVTAIELMPVADFAGSRNWGYDGVALFAPSRAYGAPDDLRRLVERGARARPRGPAGRGLQPPRPRGRVPAAVPPAYLTEQASRRRGARP